jgi:ABC-type polysaccharide/polyol phosphate export permease
MVVAQAAWIGGIYLLHDVFANDHQQNYLVFLSAGLAVWGLISGFTLDAPNGLVRSKGYIESYPLPVAIYMIRAVMAQFVTFLHIVSVFFIVVLFARYPLTPTFFLVIPGLAVLMVFGFGINMTLGFLGARFRDLGPALVSVMSLAFILTPIFWSPTPAQVSSKVVALNPFYHLLEIVRAPMLGHLGTSMNWSVAIGVSVLSFLVGVACYIRFRPTVVYWL